MSCFYLFPDLIWLGNSLWWYPKRVDFLMPQSPFLPKGTYKTCGSPAELVSVAHGSCTLVPQLAPVLPPQALSLWGGREIDLPEDSLAESHLWLVLWSKQFSVNSKAGAADTPQYFSNCRPRPSRGSWNKFNGVQPAFKKCNRVEQSSGEEQVKYYSALHVLRVSVIWWNCRFCYITSSTCMHTLCHDVFHFVGLQLK